MDDIVRQAMAKWPNVPHCYGWLGLDERGNWYMRDDRVQAAGAFPAVKGSLLRHEKLIDFIQRNYEHDPQGQWFFQNGPQRVYVELQATPWIWRLGGAAPCLPRRRKRAPVPGHRPGLRPGAHAGHAAGRRRGGVRPLDAAVAPKKPSFDAAGNLKSPTPNVPPLRATP